MFALQDTIPVAFPFHFYFSGFVNLSRSIKPTHFHFIWLCFILYSRLSFVFVRNKIGKSLIFDKSVLKKCFI